jgi:hypothetical protein
MNLEELHSNATEVAYFAELGFKLHELCAFIEISLRVCSHIIVSHYFLSNVSLLQRIMICFNIFFNV